MKPFEEFLKTKDVRRASPDIELAKSLMEEVKIRSEIAMEMKLDDKRARVIFELLYDSLRELIDALLALDGYKSYSHEAAIIYMKKFPLFSEFDITSLDSFRKIRIASKYYGKPAQVFDAIRIKEQFPILRKKLLNIIDSRIKKSIKV